MPKTEIVKIGSEEVEAVRDESGNGWVVVKKVCEVLGVDHSGQVKRLKELPWVVMEKISMTAADDKIYNQLCISTESTPQWLATINTAKVAPKVKPKLIQFQKLAAKALAEWFFGRSRSEPSTKATSIEQTLANLTKVIVDLNNNVLALRPVISTTESPKQLTTRDANTNEGSDEEVNLVDLSPSDIRKLLNRMVRRSVDYGFESEYKAAWDKLYRLYSRNSGVDVVQEAFEAGVRRGKEVIPLDWIAKYGHLYHLYRYAKSVLKPGKPRELRKVRNQDIKPDDVELSGVTDFESIWDN